MMEANKSYGKTINKNSFLVVSSIRGLELLNEDHRMQDENKRGWIFMQQTVLWNSSPKSATTGSYMSPKEVWTST